MNDEEHEEVDKEIATKRYNNNDLFKVIRIKEGKESECLNEILKYIYKYDLLNQTSFC